MKIQKPFTAKRILAIVLGIIVLGFLVIMLSSMKSVNDTAGQLFMVGGFMFTLGVALILYGLWGGKEPEIGIIPKTKENDNTKE
jgi:uncharacterized membrane protein